jgi:hypothetical protein
MQPARFKLHAKEHTNNPVQRPNFRGHALTKGGGRVLGLPEETPPEEGNLGQTKNKAPPRQSSSRTPPPSHRD